MSRKSPWAFSVCVVIFLILAGAGVPIGALADQNGEDGATSGTPMDEPRAGNTVYHTYGELTNAMQAVAFNHPTIASLSSIGQSWEGREIWAMKISDNVNVDEDEPEVYINGAHHSREWLTIEVTLYYIWFLTGNYSTNSTAQFLVDNREIWILPLINPDGREYDGAGPGDDPTVNNDWRKNRRNNGDGTWGVDLNRNYGYMWGAAGAAGSTGEITYSGPSAFSEPETQATRDFVRNRSFVTAISYHSYSQLIIWPWGCFYNPTPDGDVLEALGIAMRDNITNTAGSVQPQYTPEQASELYTTSGGDIDWLYAEKGILSYVIELYPSGSDAMADRFHPPASKVIPVCVDNLGGMICLTMAAGNPYMVMDHITLTPDPDTLLINQGTTDSFTITALNDGKGADTFDITSSSIPGWTINHPASISLLKDQSQDFLLDVTVPTFYAGGDYTIWVNATSQSNPSCHYGTTVTVVVPFFNDTAVISHSPFVENGEYPQGSVNMRSEVMNLGQLPLDPFNLTCTISHLGTPFPTTVFSEDFETDLSQWTIIDHDEGHSSSQWKRDNDAHFGVWGAWCGGTSSYGDLTIQSLETAVPISLRGASGCNLSFWHKYRIEEDWDFGNIEVSGDGGTTWTQYGRYTGIDATWHQEVLDLGDFAGFDNILIRFFFSSDGGVTEEGWHIDDVTVEADYMSETVIWGPTPELTPSILYQNDTLECSWQYTFSPGVYKATYETTLPTDERADNDLLDVVFEITPATLPSVTVTQPNSGEVWTVGTSQEITWTASAGSYPLASDPISIYYSYDGPGGPYGLLASGEPDDGTFTWDPIPNTPSNDCWILIDVEDTQGFLGSDICDLAFGITFEVPTVTVTSPNGGESLMGGGTWPITWIATGTLIPNPITIEYSVSGVGGPWIPISSNEANDGTYLWTTIPVMDEFDCFVKVTAEDTLGYTGEDVSDGAFEIDSTPPAPSTNARAELTPPNHVTVYWDPSPTSDVDHYEIWYYQNTWDPTGDTYNFLADVGLSTSYQHLNVGISNPSSYNYQIRTYDHAGNEARAMIQAGKAGSTQSIFSNPSGWFLLGYHYVQSDTSLSHIIQGQALPANMDYIQLYDSSDAGDPWKSYMVARPPNLNDLTDISNTQGFWMHLTNNARFAAAGYISDMAIPLKAGWNLVSYPFASRSMTSSNIATHLNTNCPGYDSMMIFDSSDPYRLKVPTGTETLFHLSGLWINVNADTTWTVMNY